MARCQEKTSVIDCGTNRASLPAIGERRKVADECLKALVGRRAMWQSRSVCSCKKPSSACEGVGCFERIERALLAKSSKPGGV